MPWHDIHYIPLSIWSCSSVGDEYVLFPLHNARMHYAYSVCPALHLRTCTTSTCCTHTYHIACLVLLVLMLSVLHACPPVISYASCHTYNVYYSPHALCVLHALIACVSALWLCLACSHSILVEMITICTDPTTHGMTWYHTSPLCSCGLLRTVLRNAISNTPYRRLHLAVLCITYEFSHARYAPAMHLPCTVYNAFLMLSVCYTIPSRSACLVLVSTLRLTCTQQTTTHPVQAFASLSLIDTLPHVSPGYNMMHYLLLSPHMYASIR